MTRSKQIQVRVSLTDNLYEALRYKAKVLGVPVTQFVKFLIVKEVDSRNFFMPSEKSKPAKSDKKMQDIFNKSQYFDSKSAGEDL